MAPMVARSVCRVKSVSAPGDDDREARGGGEGRARVDQRRALRALPARGGVVHDEGLEPGGERGGFPVASRGEIDGGGEHALEFGAFVLDAQREGRQRGVESQRGHEPAHEQRDERDRAGEQRERAERRREAEEVVEQAREQDDGEGCGGEVRGAA